MNLHRTVNSVLSVCLSLGDNPRENYTPDANPDAKGTETPDQLNTQPFAGSQDAGIVHGYSNRRITKYL
jgi:hypothetical protein